MYRIKTTAHNSIGQSDDSEELIVAFGRLPEQPPTPTFDSRRCTRFRNVITWTPGTSVDIPVLGYKLYTDNG